MKVRENVIDLYFELLYVVLLKLYKVKHGIIFFEVVTLSKNYLLLHRRLMHIPSSLSVSL
jgi:hypothetical protein